MVSMGDDFFWPSTCPLYPAVSCSMSASPEEYKRMIDLGDDFFWPSTSSLFPAVTCSVSASLEELRKIGFSGK